MTDPKATPGAAPIAPFASAIVSAIVKNAVDGTFSSEDVIIDAVVNIAGDYLGGKSSNYFGNKETTRQVVRKSLRDAGLSSNGAELKEAIKDIKKANATVKMYVEKITQAIVNEVADKVEGSLSEDEKSNSAIDVDTAPAKAVYTAYYFDENGQLVKYYDPLGIPNEWLDSFMYYE